jgi:hypothetical protein
MLRPHRQAANSKSKTKPARNVSKDGVFEPDQRVVIAVMAVGMLVGALLTTTPSKEAAKLHSPISQQTTHAASNR